MQEDRRQGEALWENTEGVGLPRLPQRGQTGTIKMRKISFGLQKVCFTSGDFALKNNTSRRLPTHCIIHYLFSQCEWHLRMGAAIMHAEDPTVNS